MPGFASCSNSRSSPCPASWCNQSDGCCGLIALLQVSADAAFQKDLGLDSLDAVELVMALEEEFAIEIPDSEADKITSTSDAISYIAANPMAR